MTAVRLRIGLALAAAAMAAFCATRLSFATDVARFLPSADADELAALSRLLSDSELSRTMILSLGAPDVDAAVAAADELADWLRGRPEVAWVRDGVDPELVRHVYELYFPRRFLFLSDRPEDELPARLAPAALREDARRLRRLLASPTGALVEEVAPRDPLGAFAGLLERLRTAGAGLDTRNGRFVGLDGRHAIVFVGTHASGFDARTQGRLLGDLELAFEELDRRRGGALELEQAGVNRYVVQAEREIRGDVLLIASCAFAGTGVLFLIFLRSPARFGLAVLPGVFGILVATTTGILWFGDLGGITLAFGTSLVGVAIDYPIHLLNHHSLSPGRESARAVARRLLPSLALGAGTTMASFAGLGLTSFPSFREIAFFSVVGVATALAMTLLVIPRLLGDAPPVPAFAARTAAVLARGVRALETRRRALAAVPVVLALGALLALPGLRWNDRLAALSEPDPDLVAEDERVRARVSQMDSGRFVLAFGDDAEEALARNDRVYALLETAIEAGELDGQRSLHDLLWSAELQRRNWAALGREERLADRVEATFAEEGFRPEGLRPFREALAGEPPAPLRWPELKRSPLGAAASSLVVELDGRTGVVTFLRGVADPGAVRARLAELPDVLFFDQSAFLDDVYASFRSTTLRQMAVGSALVIAVLALRYRRLRPAAAAFLPSLLVALTLLGGFALVGIETNLLHVMSLILVMGMGVDYGIFVVDSADSERDLGATLLSLLLSCLTTLFVFGTLALSSQPALRAIGLTTGLGILLSFLLAPLTLVVSGARSPGAR